MAEQVNPPPAAPASHLDASWQSRGPNFDPEWESNGEAPKSLGTYVHIGHPEEAASSGIGPA